MKYSLEFKLRAVKYYLRTGCYIDVPLECAKRTFKRKVRSWSYIYKEHGQEGLKHKVKLFSVNEKVNIINEYKKGITAFRLGIKYGIQDTLIKEWVKKYEKNGIEGLECKSGRPKLVVLTEEEKFERKLSNLPLLEKARAIKSHTTQSKNSVSFYLEKYNIPSSTYYSCLKRKTYREKNSDLYSIIQSIFKSSNDSYGVNRMKIALKIEYGLITNKKKISRIMKDLNLKVKLQKGRYRSYKGQIGRICNNIINRNFKSYKPLQKITTDVTEFVLPFGKVYLQPYLDMYNGEILCYQISRNASLNDTRFLMEKLIKKYNSSIHKTIFHSDQGWQYQTKWYQDKIKKLGCFQSMSRKGNCLDNSIMENFFGRLKMEIFYGKVFNYKNYNQFKKALENYINYYNLKRIKTKLGMSPVQYRILQENQKN